MTNAWDDVLAKRGVKPNGDGKTVATASAGETEEQIRERVFAEERDRALAIISACDLAGAPARAAAFIKSGKPVSEVIAALGSAHARPKG